MPLYEYHCPSCGGTFDKLVRFSESDKMPVCPACGEKDTRKKISAGALIGSSPASQAGDRKPASSPFT